MVEVRTLLTKYFDKVIDLREEDRKNQLQCSELEVLHIHSVRLIVFDFPCFSMSFVANDSYLNLLIVNNVVI